MDFLYRNGMCPGVIVVSVYNVDRNRDFTPVATEDFTLSGGAAPFMKYLSGELKKKVDKNYRTSGFDILAGHSLGGMFAVYALLEHPEVFDAYIAMSPYLKYADEYMIARALGVLAADPDRAEGEKVKVISGKTPATSSAENKAGKKLYEADMDKTSFYMTVGNEPGYLDPLARFASIVEENDRTFDFKYEKLEQEGHPTIPYPGLYNGLRHIFNDWIMPDKLLEQALEKIDTFYHGLSEKYGITVLTPELIINRKGYQYLGAGNIDKAIEIFTINMKRYPESANVYDSLGEAYETAGDFKRAAVQYKKAYEQGLMRLDPNVLIYESNWERVKGK